MRAESARRVKVRGSSRRRQRRHPVPLLALALAVVANLIVVSNAVRHPPEVGYDALDHLAYARVLAKGRLPVRSETREFFSAPLPYVPIAIALAVGAPMKPAAKIGQLANVAASLLLTASLLALCATMRPEDGRFAALAVGMTCLLPVYAKSFSQVRGEPWVAATTVLLVLLLVRGATGTPSIRNAVAVALAAAAAVLSRQWGVLAVGGAFLWVVVAAWRGALAKRFVKRLALVSLPVLLLGGGWFYASLALRTGSPLAFNRSPRPQLADKETATFFFGAGSGALFKAPIRPAFPNQLLPILHTEIWGDYWCFFLVSGHSTARPGPLSGPGLERAYLRRSRSLVTNRDRIAAYLGRLNLLGLPLSLLLLAAGAFGVRACCRLDETARADPAALSFTLAGAVAAASLVGYLTFLVLFPSPGKGATIKATYILHVFPMLAILAAELLSRLRARSPRMFAWSLALLVAIAVHALPALFTRY